MKIALEEHFVIPGFHDYLATSMPAVTPEAYDRLVALLSDFGDQRLAAMDAAGDVYKRQALSRGSGHAGAVRAPELSAQLCQHHSAAGPARRGRGVQDLLCDGSVSYTHLAIPTQKSVDRFKDQIRALTKRRVPLRMGELIKAINPIVRGWGNYFCRSHVRTLFHQLDGWIVRRLWSHHTKRWRNAGWKRYPTKRLRGERCV